MTTWQQALAVRAPGDLGDQGVLNFEGESELRWRAGARIGFDLHWLHEITGGVLDADFGVQVNGSAQSELSFLLRGATRADVSLEDDEWLRLVLRKGSQRESAISVQAGASGEVTQYEVGAKDPLLATLLGIPEPEELIEEGLDNLSAFRQLPAPVQRAVQQAAGAIQSEQALGQLGERLRDAIALRDRIHASAREALSTKHSAELGCRIARVSAEGVLLDCSFRFTEQGLALYRQCLKGELSGVLTGVSTHVRLRACELRHTVRKETAIELHLPFLERKWWNKRLELFAGMRAEVCGEGRVLVYTAEAKHSVEAHNAYQSALMLAGTLSAGGAGQTEAFTLTYSDRRILPALEAPVVLPPVLTCYGFGADATECLSGLASIAREIEVELAFKIPGALVSAWLNAPRERSVAFYEAFLRVSCAAQRAMRLWLPYVYFSDIDRYDDLEAAWPLLVYQASRPYSRRVRSEFTYDAMNPRSVSLALGHAAHGLPGVLETVQARLLAAGKRRTAGFYRPSQAKKIIASVSRGPRRFKNLLAADAHLVGDLVSLANRGRKLRQDMRSEPAVATKKISRFLGAFVKSFHIRLRRLYGGREILAFGSLLFVEATQALSASFGREAPIEGLLRIRVPGEEGERIFVNNGYLREDQE